MKKLGIIGWRGMVGSVLRSRMEEEGDYQFFDLYFYSTSQAGKTAPDYGQNAKTLLDANDIDLLSEMDIILTTQGGGYTEIVHPQLRKNGWSGYWIDAASTLRMNNDSLIVLDPVNRPQMDQGLNDGIKDLVGGNCTASIILMGIGGLLVNKEVEWVTSMSYQAASGAGAKAMEELLKQMEHLIGVRNQGSDDILEVEKKLTQAMNSTSFPTEAIGYPLIGGLLPWIDQEMENGQSREELKGMDEVNKILGNTTERIPIDGTCVRIGSMRCHSMGFTVKLKRDLSVENIEEMIAGQSEWVKVIPNQKEITLQELTPARVSGSLTVPVGRIRKMNLGEKYVNIFTVGDQLLWGAAEPLRRALKIIIEN